MLTSTQTPGATQGSGDDTTTSVTIGTTSESRGTPNRLTPRSTPRNNRLNSNPSRNNLIIWHELIQLMGVLVERQRILIM